MGDTVITNEKVWGGGVRPFEARYGKIMMWYFILSDALTFSGFLVAYGLMRFKFIDVWPIADEVFTHFPFIHGDYPMYYVALMTFILIFSSVTMVLAVDAGHQMKKGKVTFYMLLTIIGGVIFLGSQAWEWKHFISGEFGALQMKNGHLIQFVNTDGHRAAIRDFAVTEHSTRVEHKSSNGIWFTSDSSFQDLSLSEVIEGFNNNPNLRVQLENINHENKTKQVLERGEEQQYFKNAVSIVEGANMQNNEYGRPLFANFFFFITGFHGFHVFTGVLINIIIFFNVIIGTYDKRGHYRMVEKVGLYWHFVDLVWVFVFTFFYLV